VRRRGGPAREEGTVPNWEVLGRSVKLVLPIFFVRWRTIRGTGGARRREIGYVLQVCHELEREEGFFPLKRRPRLDFGNSRALFRDPPLKPGHGFCAAPSDRNYPSPGMARPERGQVRGSRM